LITRPKRWRIIGPSAARVRRKAPVRLTSSTRLQSSSLKRIDRLSAVMPALLTSTRTGPSSSVTVESISSAAAPSATSAPSTSAVPPSSSMEAATASAPSRSRL
jgi:hypothetical protein